MNHIVLFKRIHVFTFGKDVFYILGGFCYLWVVTLEASADEEVTVFFQGMINVSILVLALFFRAYADRPTMYIVEVYRTK